MFGMTAAHQRVRTQAGQGFNPRSHHTHSVLRGRSLSVLDSKLLGIMNYFFGRFGWNEGQGRAGWGKGLSMWGVEGWGFDRVTL